MTYYAVIFDNDPDMPGVQFCNVSPEFFIDDGGTENLTESYPWAERCMNDLKEYHEKLNYRIVEVTIKELEP